MCRVYILPTTDSAAGYYLSKKDMIYQRNIFVPFAVNPLRPMLSKQNQYDPKYMVKRNFDQNMSLGYKEAAKIHPNMPFELLENQL